MRREKFAESDLRERSGCGGKFWHRKVDHGFNRFLHLFIDNEAGTVESALTMIPLLLLFLSILQIAASVMGRTSELTNVQDHLTRTSLLSYSSSANAFGNWPDNALTNSVPDSLSNGQSNSAANASNSKSNPSTTSLETLPLTGGGSLLIEKRKGNVPILTPLLLGQDSFMTTGITVNENG